MWPPQRHWASPDAAKSRTDVDVQRLEPFSRIFSRHWLLRAAQNKHTVARRQPRLPRGEGVQRRYLPMHAAHAAAILAANAAIAILVSLMSFPPKG